MTSRADRVARNLAIAEKFYDGYHGSVERGRLEKVFMPEDFAEQWAFCSPYLGGESTQTRGPELAAGAAFNHQTIWAKIPDYKMDHFRAWPTEAGCAWRWCVNGNGTDGVHYEFWEQLFIWTNDAGEITRFEFCDDWHGFPQTLVFAYGISIDEFTRIKNYGAAPWTPGPTMTLSPPAAPPRQDPPANDRVTRNLEISRSFFDAYHHTVERGGLGGLFSSEIFADDWVLFSPWFGEKAQSKGRDIAALADAQLKRTWTRLPDYKMDHFEAWPTEDGCAWRWCVNGHAADGTRYEVWEQLFTQTDKQGKITRLEVFDDWQGFPQMLGFVTGLQLDRLWDAENYRAWIVGAD